MHDSIISDLFVKGGCIGVIGRRNVQKQGPKSLFVWNR